ncbi:MAG TPA: tetratricopeptide repeat protein [Burkholderiales bacterium]|nr:tetratricopeptide repeat protein [Burkholderiales bacterium]
MAALGLLAAMACALYLPYLGNPAVFDDRLFFSGLGFSRYASAPFGLGVRVPAYFSLAIVEVVFGRIEAHRVVSLVLHIACAWAVYALIRALSVRQACAFAGAALFAVHPVAVYGAGYLVQRSILLATLFGLLSLLLYCRGLRHGSYSDALAAAVLYSLAVLSKEHAVLLPAVAAALVPLAAQTRRFAMRYTALYFLACAPAAVLVVLLSTGVIGQAYEPYFDVVAAQVTNAYWSETLSSPWVGSVIAQAALFFKYAALWLVPITAGMSLDVRVDFTELWSPAIALPALFGFLAFGALAAYLLTKRVRVGIAAFGLWYVWILFFTEFATIRFQEPFVLYRSYLWAPGLAIAVAAALECLQPRVMLALLMPALAVLSWQANDRLQTFSSGLAVWEDAAAKLPPGAIPGGHRPLYEAGREYLYAGRVQDALQATERCMKLYPTTYDCFLARGALHIHLGQNETALPYVMKAIALRPGDGVARHHLGLILENLGCLDEAKAHYRDAVERHFPGAQHRLDRIESPGKGLLPPRQAPPPRGDCSKLLVRNRAFRPG